PAVVASADTPDGPSLGLVERAIDAIEQALEPFGGNHSVSCSQAFQAREFIRGTDDRPLPPGGEDRSGRLRLTLALNLRPADPKSQAGTATTFRHGPT
ncbi:MAG: hypothetical protein M3406_03870, partial [Chloroflexota bacterium]|nr:hypothetical protein [Chloroflexota bacterium]